jgi:chromosome segregation ATPase
MKELWD